MNSRSTLFVSIVLEPDEDGYLASVPGIQGAFAEGETIEEAIFNCVDVVKLIIGYRQERGESLGYTEVKMTPNTRLTVSLPIGIG